MKYKMGKIINKIKIIIAFIFMLYVSIVVFINNLPSKIFELWEDLKWWKFILLTGFIIYAVYCLISVLIADYIGEISKKTNRIISSGLGILILFIVSGIFNFKHDDSIFVLLILIPMFLIFYFSLTIKLDKLTNFSYKKGWFDGFKDNITGYYGKSYEDGYYDGIRFKKESEKNTNQNQ